MQQKQPKFSPITELVLASHNKGKLAEIKSMLAPLGVSVTSAADLNLEEPEETEKTFRGNAAIKARAVMLATGKPSLADDSGLACDALGGAPGVDSKPWAEQYADYNEAMAALYALVDSHKNYNAAYVAVLALAVPDQEGLQYFEGRCEGHLIHPTRGTNGFGYDPMFIPNGETRTFGEMDASDKKQYSHRAKALEKFIKQVF